MINTQDELASLNHQLNHKLDGWRRQQRLYNKTLYFCSHALFTLLIMLVVIKLGNTQAWKDLEINAGLQLLTEAVAISIVMPLILSYCKQKLYRKLLSRGLDLNRRIYQAYTGSGSEKNADDKTPVDKIKPETFQEELINLLENESSFPHSWKELQHRPAIDNMTSDPPCHQDVKISKFHIVSYGKLGFYWGSIRDCLPVSAKELRVERGANSFVVTIHHQKEPQG
ncbi:MAG: hypothetical protein ACK587_17610 [Cyanobacteriota bacterium]